MYYLLYLDEKNTEMAWETEQTADAIVSWAQLRAKSKAQQRAGRDKMPLAGWRSGNVVRPAPFLAGLGPTFEPNQAHGPLVGAHEAPNEAHFYP